MRLEKLLEVLHTDLSSKDDVFDSVKLILDAQRLSGAEIDTLIALYRAGPLFDGGVPSKHGRDKLVDKGMACRVVVKGDDGYNACTLPGARVYRLIVSEGPEPSRPSTATPST